MKKSQSAVEYLVVIAIAIGLLIPTIYVFLKTTSDSTAITNGYQIANIARKIVTNAEAVYAMGSPSWITMDVNLPSIFQNATIIDGHELVLYYKTPHTLSEVVVYSTVPLIGNNSFIYNGFNYSSLTLHPGRNKFRLVVEKNGVKIE